MTAKFDAFKAELEALCRKHRIVLSSTGYDGLAASDMDVGGIGESRSMATI